MSHKHKVDSKDQSSLVVPISLQEFELFQKLLTTHNKHFQKESTFPEEKEGDSAQSSSPAEFLEKKVPSPISTHFEDQVAPPDPDNFEQTSSDCSDAHDDFANGPSVSTSRKQSQQSLHSAKNVRARCLQEKSKNPSGTSTPKKVSSKRKAALNRNSSIADGQGPSPDFQQLRSDNLPPWTTEKKPLDQTPKDLASTGTKKSADLKMEDKSKSSPKSSSNSSFDSIFNEVKPHIRKSSIKSFNLFQKKVHSNKSLMKKLNQIEPDNLKGLLLKSFSKASKNQELMPSEKAFLKGLKSAKLLFLISNTKMIKNMSAAPWYKIFI